MGKNSYYKSIITNYNHIVDVLMQRGIVKRQNSLSVKPESAKKLKIEYSTKNTTAQVLFDTSLSAIELYNCLLTNNQFNMEFSDGSILLFECIVEGANIIKQRIVYIKPFEGFISDEDLLTSWENHQMEAAQNMISFPVLIRIDYDYKNETEHHPISHLTLSNIRNCRIPARGNVGIDRFIEFILQQNFNIYDISIPKLSQVNTIRKEEESYMHINWT